MRNRWIPFALVLGAAAFFPAWGIGAPPAVNQPQVCLECHSDLEDAFQLAHVHTAFADGECSSCHNPHAARHAALLRSELGTLCLKCHEDMAGLADLATPHRPAAVGECTSCHDPHGSGFAANTLAPPAQLCAGCHEDAARWASRKVVHDPVAEGECMACHLPHGGAEEGLVRAAVPGLCLECHDAGPDLDRAHAGRSLVETDCTACHDPHASSGKGLLRTNQHQPFASGQCSRCHPGLESGGSFELAVSVSELCLGCHRSVAPSQKADFPHIMNTGNSCAECHNPHASNSPQLLLKSQVKLCMGCHFGDREGRPKEEFITHDGMDCVNCHRPHGTDNPRLLVQTDSGLCVDCHEQAHRSTHPVGPDVIDPRTEDSVTCMSCHQLHGAEFSPYLPLNPDMELCLQCHKK